MIIYNDDGDDEEYFDDDADVVKNGRNYDHHDGV